MTRLHYRAGTRALERIRRGGLSAADVRMLLAPAAGPKWLAVVGLDRALLASGLLEGTDKTLVGSSAGAWRAFALAGVDPRGTHHRLTEAYLVQRFDQRDTPRTISDAYRALLQQVFPDPDVQHAVAHPTLRLCLLAARGRRGTAAGTRAVQLAALGAAALSNALSSRSQPWFFERTVFHSGPGTAATSRLGARAVRVPMTTRNARDVLLASGTVPLVMAPVAAPVGSPGGHYLDGGLTDYHVAQPITCQDGVALLFMHQRRLIPGWFDKQLPHRKPDAAWLADVLQVHPSPSWVASLPGGAVPTREDFTRFIDAPEVRIQRWREAVARSEELGEQFLDDLHAGRIADLVEPI